MYIDLYSLQSTVQSNQIVKWENVTLLYILRKPRAVRRLSRAPTLLLHNFTFQSYTQLYQAYFSLVINRRGYGRLVHTPTCAHTHTQQHTCTHKHPHMCTHTHTYMHTHTLLHTVSILARCFLWQAPVSMNTYQRTETLHMPKTQV